MIDGRAGVRPAVPGQSVKIRLMNTVPESEIPRRMGAAAGLKWLVDGFALYRRSPLLLSLAFGAMFGVVMALGLIPGLGPSLSEFALPLLTAGFLAAYRTLDEGRELEPPVFLAGVRGPLLPLVTIGAFQLLGTVLISQAMLAMGFDPEALRAVMENDKATPQEMRAVVNQALPAALLGLSLLSLLSMATLFAPALVLFGGARPLVALAVSFKACLRNLMPLFVLGLVAGLLVLFSLLIPMLLGLLFSMPLLLAALYAAYQSLFAIWSEDPPQSVDSFA